LNDIVERLDEDFPWNDDAKSDLVQEAIDEIVRLRAEVQHVNKAMDLTVRKIIKVEAERDRLRDALEKLIERADESDDARYGTMSTTYVRDIARAAKGDT
jgi:hypothetical protein